MNDIIEQIKTPENIIFEKVTNVLQVSGTAILELWGGGKGKIVMRPYNVKTDGIFTMDELARAIFNNANDCGFGCEHIKSIDVDIDQIYRAEWRTTTKFICHLTIDKDGKIIE